MNSQVLQNYFLGMCFVPNLVVVVFFPEQQINLIVDAGHLLCKFPKRFLDKPAINLLIFFLGEMN